MNWNSIRKTVAEILYPEVFEALDIQIAKTQDCFKEVENLRAEVEKWKTAYEKQKESAEKAWKRVRDLEQKLKINPRTIPYAYIEADEVKKYNIITGNSVRYISKQYDKAGYIEDIEVADTEYIVLPIDVMKEWLTRVYEFKEHIPWEKQIFDCDDHAEIMHALVAYSWYRSWKDGKLSEELSKEKRQIAFGEAWSLTHAFNLFFAIDEDGKVKPYIYEPQRNKVMGLLSEFSEEGWIRTYTVKEIYFTT